MKLSVEKALQVCGNNNRYQKIFFIAVALTWFSVDFISISFPLLELLPNFQCRKNGSFVNCPDEDYCKITNEADRRINDLTYHNIVTDFKLYCDKTLIIIIGVVYTFGILIGAFLSSKFCDVLGRKPVLLLCQFLFACGGISLTMINNIYLLFGVLFFIGISCAGGTMVSFLFIYEVIAQNKRSLYGTLINSAFAIAGIIYMTCFKYLKDWKYIAYICTTTDIIAGLLILTYFTESPRYLIAKGNFEKALKSLYKIAKRNGKSKDFYKYLVSDLVIEKEYKEEGQFLNSTAANSQSSSSNRLNNDIGEPPNGNVNNADRPINNTTVNTEVNDPKSNLYDSTSFKKLNIEELVKNFKKMDRDHDSNGEETENKNEPFLNKNTEKKDNISIKSSAVSLKEKTKEVGFLSLIKYKSLRSKFLICCLMWFIMSFVYYGISLGLKKNKEDVFVDGYVVYGAEGISYMITGIIISIAFFGRVRSLSIMMLLTAVSSLLYFFVKMYELEPYDKILLFVARFSVTAIFSIMYTYSTEVYPTQIRAKGLGLNTLSARMASILVPIVVELVNPFTIFAVLGILGFIFSFFLPETFGKELEEEIQEEKLKKKTNHLEY
jgi:MFS family permease